MNSSKWIWRSVSIVSAAATLLLIVGFVYAVKDINYPQGSKTETALPSAPKSGNESVDMDQKKELKIAAIGDSLTKGTGDNSGSGYVRRSMKELSEHTGKKVTLLNNLGINGLTTAGLLPKLEEHGTMYVLEQADIIFLSIGGNDLFKGAEQAAMGGQAGSASSAQSTDKTIQKAGELSPEELLKALPQASRQLQHILESIRKINPQALIVYVGLYNPFGDLKELKVSGNQAVTAWNDAALSIINKNDRMVLVPTFDLFQINLNKYLSSDHFHPNGDGYQRIAERIVQAIR